MVSALLMILFILVSYLFSSRTRLRRYYSWIKENLASWSALFFLHGGLSLGHLRFVCFVRGEQYVISFFDFLDYPIAVANAQAFCSFDARRRYNHSGTV